MICLGDSISRHESIAHVPFLLLGIFAPINALSFLVPLPFLERKQLLCRLKEVDVYSYILIVSLACFGCVFLIRSDHVMQNLV